MSGYEFTNTWFEDVARKRWELIPKIKPKTILEIGSYEGASACYLIEKFGSESEIEIHCRGYWQHREQGWRFGYRYEFG
jgi:hypothetical protein